MKIFLIIFLLFVSCSSTGEIDYQGDYTYNNSFTSDEIIWIKNGFNRWNNWVGYNIVTVVPGNKNYCSIDIEQLNDNRVGQIVLRTNSISIDIIKLKKYNNYNQIKFESVIMHEIGHSLGFNHVDQNGSLMSPIGGLDFTVDDRIQCINLKLCK